MRRYVASRLLQATIVVLLVTTVTFVLVHLAPGDPIALLLDRPGVTEEVRQQWRASFGLDRPLGEQYLRWIANTLRGDLGYSISFRRPVADMIGDALPRTLLLVGLALTLSFALGIVVAVLQSERPGSARDRWLGRMLLVLYSVPDFWFALVLLIVFAYRLPILPPRPHRASRRRIWKTPPSTVPNTSVVRNNALRVCGVIASSNAFSHPRATSTEQASFASGVARKSRLDSSCGGPKVCL